MGDKVTLSTGVELRVKAVPAWLLNDISNSLERPKPPKFVKDGWETDNPDDPEYQEAMKRYDAKVSEKLNDAMIVMGTSAGSVPQGVEPVKSDKWRRKLAVLGKKIDEDEDSLYLAWVKYVAGPKMDDIQKIIQEVGRESGVAEADVKTSVDNFRR